MKKSVAEILMVNSRYSASPGSARKGCIGVNLPCKETHRKQESKKTEFWRFKKKNKQLWNFGFHESLRMLASLSNGTVVFVIGPTVSEDLSHKHYHHQQLHNRTETKTTILQEEDTEVKNTDQTALGKTRHSIRLIQVCNFWCRIFFF